MIHSSREHIKVYLTAYPVIFKAVKMDLPGTSLLPFRKRDSKMTFLLLI